MHCFDSYLYSRQRGGLAGPFGLGHLTVDRPLVADGQPTMTSEDAWDAVVSAEQSKYLRLFKTFFLKYVRKNKDLTFIDLEKKFRKEGLDVYLIAFVHPPPKANLRKNPFRPQKHLSIYSAR